MKRSSILAANAIDILSREALDKIIERHQKVNGRLLAILEEAQELNRNKFLPDATLEYISAKTDIPLSQLYGVVTFYALFNLKPQGDHTITICRGTACHTRGSKQIFDELKPLLKIKEQDEGRAGEKVFLTTDDNKFTIRTVACFGQCALAPVVAIDENIYSNVTTEKLKRLIRQIARNGKNGHGNVGRKAKKK